MQERRKLTAASERQAFAGLVRRALERFVGEARTPSAEWGLKPNLGWVRFMRPDGRFVYLAVRRHLNWITGEVGSSREPRELESLELRAVPDSDAAASYRVRLGHLIHDEDKWWPAGTTEKDLVERIEWIVLQMSVKLDRFLRAKKH